MKATELEKLAANGFFALGIHLRTDAKVYNPDPTPEVPAPKPKNSQIHHVLVGVDVVKIVRYIDKPEDVRTFAPQQKLVVTLAHEKLPREPRVKGQPPKPQGYAVKLMAEPEPA